MFAGLSRRLRKDVVKMLCGSLRRGTGNVHDRAPNGRPRACGGGGRGHKPKTSDWVLGTETGSYKHRNALRDTDPTSGRTSGGGPTPTDRSHSAQAEGGRGHVYRHPRPRPSPPPPPPTNMHTPPWHLHP